MAAPIEIGRRMPQPQPPLRWNPDFMTCAFLWHPIRFASGVFACLLLVALISRANVETPTRLDAIIGAGVLRVGLTEDYRPFSFAAASDRVEGIDVDMATSLAQSLGVKLDIVKTSWSTLKSDLEANGFDIAMGGVTITLDRQKVGLFSNPVFSSGKTPITHCGDEPKYATIAAIDQPGVHVIVNPGGTNERFDRAHLQKATIIQWSDNATIFDALVEGKADLMITDTVETRVQAKLHPGVLCPVHPNAPFDHSELAYWMPRDPISRRTSISGSTCSTFRASIRRSSPDGCPEYIQDLRSVTAVGLVEQQGSRNSAPGGNRFSS
jgi:cyclohexadienyl dehydratase